MSSARLFEETTERYGSQWRTVTRVTCRKCGMSCSLGLSSPGGLLPPNIITKKLEQKGWAIGANAQWDLCPSCANKEKKMPVLSVVTPDKMTKSASETPPREMSRDDRRVIFAKLDEVYLDEKRGYDSGWSDHKVASDLGVPRKWVEIIRAENFGAIGTNEDMADFLSKAEILAAEARTALAAAKKAREDIEAVLKRPEFFTLTTLSDRLSKVERLAAEVRKLVVVS